MPKGQVQGAKGTQYLSLFAMETCIKEDTDYQGFYSGKVTSLGDVISMKVNTVVRGTLVNFDQLPKGLA